MKPVRLDKLLANLGYGSRRDIQAMAERGRISVDGAEIGDAAARVSPQSAIVIDGEPMDPPPGLCVMLHKPLGVTCSHKDVGPLVCDLLPQRWRRRDPALSTVGRLDKETSGLLLLTDDGALLHRIISPKQAIEKRYRATLARPLRGDEARAFASGTLMLEGEDKPLLPARLEALSSTEALLTISEGRYHQVRRMFAAVGNHVEALHRDVIGALALPADLEAGDWRIMGPGDVAAVLG